MTKSKRHHDDFAKRTEILLTDVTVFPVVMGIIDWTHRNLEVEHREGRYPYKVESADNLCLGIENFYQLEQHFLVCRPCRILARSVVDGLQNILPKEN